METITPKGNLTLHDHQGALAQIRAGVARKTDLLIDLSEVGQVDSLAVAHLLELIRNAQFNNHSVRFAHLPERLTKLVRLYELEDYFKAEERA